MSEEIQNMDRLMAKLNNLETQSYVALKQGVWKAAERVRAEAVLLCPVNHGELRQSIKSSVRTLDGRIIGTIYTNKEYARYVEFGTGPVGLADHDGISPEVNPSYVTAGWYIPASEFSQADIEKYHFKVIQIGEKEFVYTEGQPAQPFMYPALKNNKKVAGNIIMNNIRKEIERL